jgi:hypothetical protein
MAEGAFVALRVCPKTTCLSWVTRPELPDVPRPPGRIKGQIFIIDSLIILYDWRPVLKVEGREGQVLNYQFLLKKVKQTGDSFL